MCPGGGGIREVVRCTVFHKAGFFVTVSAQFCHIHVWVTARPIPIVEIHCHMLQTVCHNDKAKCNMVIQEHQTSKFTILKCLKNATLNKRHFCMLYAFMCFFGNKPKCGIKKQGGGKHFFFSS